MVINRKTGLVLEGGGMRGVFTSGVLDAFMKHQLYFRYVVAVSAGACNGLSYASHQPRRARLSNIDMLVKYDYLSLKHLIRQGCIFDPELLYDRFPNELIPYDYDTYFSNDMTFEMVVTNCLTGRAEYLEEHEGNRQRLLDICRASSSLPYVSKIIDVDGSLYLDGGIVDSIPVMRAIETGHERNVLVLTRNRGYRKTGRDLKIPPFIYRRYPRLRVVLSRRIKEYNRQLEMVEQMEARGEVLCIRPERPLEVDRIEKDPVKLEALYEEGFRLGDEFCESYLSE
ncbi:MAG: patatin family protein [Prevotella sp.]|uniref:patatin-like phospholipase family protein n=1 Tax=Prevotella sp. P5-92 TaxID=2024222 RepID=UPI000B95D535|nr:patatin family protein [Prevotella sp. P5-92]MCI7399103.1 patatin family protein [Prevotella sp.]MDD6818923.1 patatin family protein [Prevotella sp.]MDY4653554.1 patatin family protein [Prevotella sp.]OYP57295.1 patatin family protein [Prevotella sp. P5-92]